MTEIVQRLRFLASGQDDPHSVELACAADEIERLREALRHYVRECDCNGGTFYEHDHITGKDLVKDCPKCEPARAALGEKE